MKMFLWKYLSCVTRNYHPEGGLVIFAESLARAKELADATDDFDCDVILDVDSDGVIKKPDIICETDATEERVIAFRDAGCC